MSCMSPKQLIETVRAVLAATKNGPGPIAVVVNNNQPGTQHIIETAAGVTLDVGTKLYASARPEALLKEPTHAMLEAARMLDSFPDDQNDSGRVEMLHEHARKIWLAMMSAAPRG